MARPPPPSRSSLNRVCMREFSQCVCRFTLMYLTDWHRSPVIISHQSSSVTSGSVTCAVLANEDVFCMVKVAEAWHCHGRQVAPHTLENNHTLDAPLLAANTTNDLEVENLHCSVSNLSQRQTRRWTAEFPTCIQSWMLIAL